MITEREALEYETAKTTLVQSFIFLWFPKYFEWLLKRRYRRYLGYMEYKRIQKEEDERQQRRFEMMRQVIFPYKK